MIIKTIKVHSGLIGQAYHVVEGGEGPDAVELPAVQGAVEILVTPESIV